MDEPLTEALTEVLSAGALDGGVVDADAVDAAMKDVSPKDAGPSRKRRRKDTSGIDRLRSALETKGQDLNAMIERAQTIEQMAMQGVAAPDSVYSEYMQTLERLVKEIRMLQEEIREVGGEGESMSQLLDTQLQELSDILNRLATNLENVQGLRRNFGIDTLALQTPQDVVNYYGVWAFQEVQKRLSERDTASRTVPTFVANQRAFLDEMIGVMDFLQREYDVGTPEHTYYTTEVKYARERKRLFERALALLVLNRLITADDIQGLYRDDQEAAQRIIVMAQQQ